MKTEMGRREFIKRGFYAVLAVLGLGFLVPAVRLFSPFEESPQELVYFPLMPEYELPRAGVKKGEVIYTVSGKERKARVFIVSSQKNLTVLSATCSHLGCLVNYSKEKQEFLCPCHGGRYDLSGKNIAGPPPAPLRAMPVKIDGSMVLVGIKV